ncbi:hypothetical protein Bca52824_075880 [Brassica carinata]|uniref:Uncharacterized protein n=1 Tax=Brassica carinata TaxID=52824 RepID=A0A8X7PR68_BRACI|nr:hypothetical protein Bca52824_075880 [Brassica carinata]
MRINPGGANNETTPPKSVPTFLMLSHENFHVALSLRHHAVSRLHAIKLPTLVLAIRHHVHIVPRCLHDITLLRYFIYARRMPAGDESCQLK